ncbi:MAG: D-2-hydroxyacid dehydrogenase, partial [Pseudomonadota bacterium]
PYDGVRFMTLSVSNAMADTATVQTDRPVLVMHTEPQQTLALLSERYPNLQFQAVTHGDLVAGALAEYDPEIVFSISGPAFPRACFEAVFSHPRLKWMQVGGSGYDHLPAWDKDRIKITHCAGVLAPYLAETITGAMLALNGHFLHYRTLQSVGDWRPMPFRPLADQTLLIIGFGAIGQRLAHNAKALGMRVLATRRTPGDHALADEVHGSERDVLLSLLPQADIVSLHLRFDTSTKRYFDAECFDAMKQGSIFINTARGRVVNQADMNAALQSGKFRGAYLDVFEREPLPADDPLWQAPNTLITPHSSDNILGFTDYYTTFFADNLSRYLAGTDLSNEID